MPHAKKKTSRSKKTTSAASRVRHIKGQLTASRARFAVITADFNEYFTSLLVEGAVDSLVRHGVSPKHIDVIHVPGSFEIPLVVQRLMRKKKYDAVIALGMVIKGETRHFSHVVDASAKGTLQAALQSDIPVIHGVVAAENLEQAINRTGGKLGNKGREAAEAVLVMTDLLRKV